MYMLETHGVAEPVTGSLTERLKKTLPIFPDVTVYLLELAVIFGVGMLLISALFPIQLGPEYTPQAAAAIAAQPDWYFLWIYQILKINIFETAGLPVALTFASAVFVVLILLPFIDKGDDRRILDRPKFVILGAVFVAELVVLAAWGLITPGQVIPNLTAVEVLGGTALVVTLAVAGVYAAVRPTGAIAGPASSASPSAPVSGPVRRLYEGKWMGLGMSALMGFGALGIGISVDSVVQMIEFGVTTPMLVRFSASACLMIGGRHLRVLGASLGRQAGGQPQRHSVKRGAEQAWTRLRGSWSRCFWCRPPRSSSSGASTLCRWSTRRYSPSSSVLTSSRSA